MNTLPASYRFWIAVLVIGGYLAFGGLCAMWGVQEGSTVYVISVLSTMGPLVGWVVKGLFEGPQPTGMPEDPVHTVEEKSDGG